MFTNDLVALLPVELPLVLVQGVGRVVLPPAEVGHVRFVAELAAARLGEGVLVPFLDMVLQHPLSTALKSTGGTQHAWGSSVRKIPISLSSRRNRNTSCYNFVNSLLVVNPTFFRFEH